MKKLKRIISMITAMATSVMLAITANAEGGELASSKAVTGTKALLNDLSNVLLVVALIAGSRSNCWYSLRDLLCCTPWRSRRNGSEKVETAHYCCGCFHSNCCSGFGSHQGTRKLLPVRRGNMTTDYTSGFPP